MKNILLIGLGRFGKHIAMQLNRWGMRLWQWILMRNG